MKGERRKEKQLTIALAGNANVGKSAIFNQLTGLNQVVGNWPGKTVERAEGTLHFKGYRIKVLDLPGIYSLSTYSIEEVIAREYIAIERPDLIINVVDASALERNLYFTLQLLELEAPMILDLNQVDFAAKKGMEINVEKLSRALGIPVVPTVAISGVGIEELLNRVIDVVEGRVPLKPMRVRYGREVETRVQELERHVQERLPELCQVYPPRWIAVKMLERDPDILGKVRSHQHGAEVLEFADRLAREIEELHGEPSPVVIASERYRIANTITQEVVRFIAPPRITLEQRLDAVTTHPALGYPILAAVVAAMFTAIFMGGDLLIGVLESFFEDWLIPLLSSTLMGGLPPPIVELVCGGIVTGVAAGVTIALPYIIPFYVILAILEDSGYLPRAAFLMDSLMHKVGLHGKAFIPLILGYGCNVPACVGCRIMETERERFLAGILVTLMPCAARTVIILGLVGRYVGLPAALALYAFDLILVFVIGRVAFKTLPGEPVGLIMEMPPYKRPSLRNVLMKTWGRTKDFVYVAFPLIILGSFVLELIKVAGLAWALSRLMQPLISGWLGLPPICGIPLIFGVLRKELTLVMLAELSGTSDFISVLTPTQMVVFSLVTMIYIPCIATIAAMVREFGWRRALAVTLMDIALALLLGGIALRVLQVWR